MNTHDKSIWDEVRAMPDSQAEANALADPDNAPTDAMFWANMDMQEPECTPQS